MRAVHLALLISIALGVLLSAPSSAQERFMDAKLGLAVWSGGGSSTGLLLGAAVDFPMDKIYLRPEFNINTLSGTPVELAGLVKYDISKFDRNTAYVDGGLGIWLYTGGPYLGLNFGGGVIFALTDSKLSIPVDLRLGPIFASGSSVFQFTLTGAVRFSLQ